MDRQGLIPNIPVVLIHVDTNPQTKARYYNTKPKIYLFQFSQPSK